MYNNDLLIENKLIHNPKKYKKIVLELISEFMEELGHSKKLIDFKKESNVISVKLNDNNKYETLSDKHNFDLVSLLIFWLKNVDRI
jgi:hypothetical protein